MLPPAAAPWFAERPLGPKCSLGSLLVIVLCKTIKYNLAILGDPYLHTNCLAALANMAPHFANLSSLASQRLLSLLLSLAKKYSRLRAAAAGAGGADAAGASAPAGPGAGATGAAQPAELFLYADILRNLLLIVDACFTHALPRNPELLYGLLHRQVGEAWEEEREGEEYRGEARKEEGNRGVRWMSREWRKV